MKRLLFALFLVSCFEVDSHEFNPAHLIVDERTETDFKYEATVQRWMHVLGLREDSST